MAENFLGSARNGGEEMQPRCADKSCSAKGDAGHELYVVRSGELQILDGNRVFETVGSGRHSGRDGAHRWRPAQRHRAGKHRKRGGPVR